MDLILKELLLFELMAHWRTTWRELYCFFQVRTHSMLKPLCGGLLKHLQANILVMEDNVHHQSYTHAQESPEKTLSSHFRLTPRLCTSRKWMLRQSCKLPSWVLRSNPICRRRHTKSGRNWASRNLNTSLSNHYLTVKLIRLQWPNKNTDFIQSVQKSYCINKKQKQKQSSSKSNPGEKGESKFQNCCIIVLQMPGFQ